MIKLPLGKFFLLEFTLHHKRWILDIKFAANIVVPFLLRLRSSLYRCDSKMLLITVFFSPFNISIYFFNTLFVFFLSVRTMGAGDASILTVRIVSYDQIFDIFEFFESTFSFLNNTSFVPIWIILLSGFF